MFYRLNRIVNIMFSMLNTNCYCNLPACVRHSLPFGTLTLRFFDPSILRLFDPSTGSGQALFSYRSLYTL